MQVSWIEGNANPQREGFKSWDTATHTLEWLTFDDKWIKMKILMAGEKIKKKGTFTLEN